MKSIELLGTRVIPELKKRGSSAVAASLELGIRQVEAESVTHKHWHEMPAKPI